MVETGNWLTPQFDYGVPFWGKPPLSTWLRAISFELFGINEFAARLPSWLIALGIAFLTFRLGRREKGEEVAWIATTLLTTTVLFYLLAGAVLMDPLLTLGTTLSMLAFWRAMRGDGRRWGYLVFVGLAIGLLAKGPVTIVLTGLPLFL
ncbi:MAG TPA: phospholipid carrier-dependent glycosyltransferase, partial [Chromatiales bacterium]|nr:phospholipid carrier-dependent glycosyltransferase [Chromatiales bacterium]